MLVYQRVATKWMTAWWLGDFFRIFFPAYRTTLPKDWICGYRFVLVVWKSVGWWFPESQSVWSTEFLCSILFYWLNRILNGNRLNFNGWWIRFNFPSSWILKNWSRGSSFQWQWSADDLFFGSPCHFAAGERQHGPLDPLAAEWKKICHFLVACPNSQFPSYCAASRFLTCGNKWFKLPILRASTFPYSDEARKAFQWRDGTP